MSWPQGERREEAASPHLLLSWEGRRRKEGAPLSSMACGSQWHPLSPLSTYLKSEKREKTMPFEIEKERRRLEGMEEKEIKGIQAQSEKGGSSSPISKYLGRREERGRELWKRE